MEPLVPVLWQDGKDNSGWPVVCVPPGRAAEIIVTIEVCERTGREKKLSVVRQGGGLLKVYVNPEVDEPDEWEFEGNSARLLVGTVERRICGSNERIRHRNLNIHFHATLTQ